MIRRRPKDSILLTCFLFINHSDREAMLSVRLAIDGQIDQAFKMRTIEEIRELQLNCKTIIVMPSEWGQCLELELPWLAERKAREAIPYALEDHVAQSVSYLHFSFDRAYYNHQTYLIVAIAKAVIEEWMHYFQICMIHYDAITLDWFALHEREACLLDQRVLIRAESYNGALSFDIWDDYPHEWANSLQWQAFSDSSRIDTDAMPLLIQNESASYVWMAQRLLNNKIINLCQGPYQHDSRRAKVTRWYQIAGLCAGLWVLCFLIINTVWLLNLSHKNAQLDKDIEASYRVFFPDAHRVVSPKVRIMQLLKNNQNGHDAVFWSLMEKVSTSLAQEHHDMTHANAGLSIVLQDLQFQDQVLTITLRCDSFASLEKLESALRRSQVQVHQLSAATEAQQVIAKLELSL